MQGEQQLDEVDEDNYYHCNGCGIEPIRGARWHCDTCADFDVCSACYANLNTAGATAHDITHTFAKHAIGCSDMSGRDMGEDGDAAGVPVGHTPYSWVSQGATVPVGHTPFSWTGSTARKPPGPDPFSEIEEQGRHGYEKGQRVRVRGLQKKPHLNGSVGTVDRLLDPFGGSGSAGPPSCVARCFANSSAHCVQARRALSPQVTGMRPRGRYGPPRGTP
jgi:hypothetical protein